MKRKVLYVQWQDAQAFAGWMSPEHYSTSLIESVGFLVKETKYSLSLAACVSMNEECNSVICIPKAWILKRKTIKLS